MSLAEDTLAEMANRCSVDMELWDRHANAVLASIRALQALAEAERLDAEFQEMLSQADLEGWSEPDAESHLNSAWKPVAAAYEIARTLRAEVLK